MPQEGSGMPIFFNKYPKISKIMHENMPATNMVKISINFMSIKIQNKKTNYEKNGQNRKINGL